MKTSTNPVLSSLSNSQGGYQGGYQDGYGSAYGMPTDYGQQGYQPQAVERAMTVDDVISKTGITLGIIILTAIVNFAIGLNNPSLALMLTAVGAIGGLITVMISSFGKKYGSKAVTLTYAGFEGFFVGGISLLFSGTMIGQENGMALIGQAIVGTVGVFVGMLWVYKTGTIRMTPKLNRFITASIMGVLAIVVVNLILSLFGISTGLYSGGPVAIIFSLFCIGLAALSFLQDFDIADQLIKQNAPERMAWGVALGLAVTLVWLYTEILRLLSYFNQR